MASGAFSRLSAGASAPPRRWCREQEINLPLLQVDGRDAHPHPTAEAEAAPGALAHQRVLVFQEQVVVVVERADMHQAFDEEGVQQHEEAERSNAGYRAIELVAQVALHELDFLQVNAVAFRGHGYPFPLTGVARDL